MLDIEGMLRLTEEFALVDFSPGYRLGDFDCEIEEYNEWLLGKAVEYIQNNYARVHLLINRKNGDVVAYMSLCTDSFIIEKEAREKYNLTFSTLPALKIGKLAVCKKYCKRNVGTYMIQLVIGLADHVLKSAGCRFITVDADIKYNKKTPEFYLKNGFVYNEHSTYINRIENRSMRYDIFQE